MMHEVSQYRSALCGVEAIELKTTRQFPRHSHDQFGIGVITSGGHRSWSSLGAVNAVCGDIIMVNPGEMHDGMPIDGKPRGWKMLFFEPEVAFQILGDEEACRSVTLRPTVCDRHQYSMFTKIFDAVTSPQPDLPDIDESLLKTLTHAFRHHGSRAPSRFPALPSVDKVVKLIDRDPENPISLREMADMTGVSRFHFLRAFTRVTGATPHAYLVQRRVSLARRLLAAGHEVGRASIDAGFADQSHMTRAFVKQIGITPARYRQAISEQKIKAISFKTGR